MKILHTADIHLREYMDERWKTLQKLIEIGKKEKIGIFVVSGDLFDKGIDAENLRPKIREMLSNTGFKIVLILGNHDKDSYKSGMYFGEDIIILDNSPPEYDDAKIIGMPYEDIESEEVLNRLRSLKHLLTPDKKNILVFHGELLDAFFSRKDFGEEGEGRYMPVKLSYFKDLNVDYVLAGHFHSTFDVRLLENGGYFVYPGSPVSITRREIGQRKVNIFEVGKPPQEYKLDTYHFEEVMVELDPFKDKQPLEIIKKRLQELHPKAEAILTVKGFINGKQIQLTETELVDQIKKVAKDKCVEIHLEFKDVQTVLDDDLFKLFAEKLKQAGYEEQKIVQMRNIAIKAMMEARL